MYKVLDAFRVKDQTVIALDKKRNVVDLGAKLFVCGLDRFPVNWIHPDEFISIQFLGNPSDLVGKTIELTR